jgi:NAD(P)-dependent dehydrogenase (short-subunit alcohol dehydrogenase family)
VTGAGRGLGIEIALQLADRGLHVVLTSRNGGDAEHITDRLAIAGRSLAARQLDVTDQAGVDSCVASILDDTGRLDVLVNNGGISDGDQQAIEADLVLADQVWQVNVLGAWRCAQAVIPTMTSAGYGRIVNVSSTMGSLTRMTSGSEPAYRVSKAGLNAVTRTLAAELVGTGVLVNSASPGWVRTDLGGPRAPRDVTEGADTPVWLATLPDDGPTGGFFLDRRPLDW